MTCLRPIFICDGSALIVHVCTCGAADSVDWLVDAGYLDVAEEQT